MIKSRLEWEIHQIVNLRPDSLIHTTHIYYALRRFKYVTTKYNYGHDFIHIPRKLFLNLNKSTFGFLQNEM